MAHEIQLGVNVNAVKRSIFEISQTIDRSFGKGKSFEIFSKDTKKFLLSEASKAITEIKNEMAKLAKEAEEYRKQLEKASDNDEHAIRLKERLLKIERDRASFQEDIEKLQEGKRVISAGSLGPLGKVVSKIPGGVGTLLSSLMRGGIGAGGLALGGIGLAGAFAFSRAMQGYAAFESAAPQRLALRGRGINNVTGFTPELGGMGFNPTDVRGAQEQGIGIFGLEASQTNSRQLRDRLRFARMTGMAPDAIQGMFAGTQSQTGFAGANKAFEEFKATIMADKLTHQLAPYLEATNQLLTQINEDGLALTGDAIRSLASISGKGDLVSAQQAARLISGIDATIKGSQGDTRAFFMQAFAQKGIGGGMLGGAEAATQLGLFGGSEDALKRYQQAGLIKDSRFVGDMKSLGLVGQTAAKQRAGAIKDALDQISARFPGEEALGPNASPKDREKARLQKRLGQGFALMSLTGGSNILDAQARYGALQKMAEAKSPQEYERLAKQYEDEFGQKSMEDLMKSSEGHLAKIEASTQKAQEYLGEQVAPTVLEIKSIVADIDEILGHTLGGIATVVEGLFTTKGSWLGKGMSWAFGPEMPGSEDKKKLLTGDIYSENFDSMSFGRRSELIGSAREELAALKKEEKEAAARGESTGAIEGQEDKLRRVIQLLEEANQRAAEAIRIQGYSEKHLNKMSAKSTAPKADKNGHKTASKPR